jgi:hypothetical protein
MMTGEARCLTSAFTLLLVCLELGPLYHGTERCTPTLDRIPGLLSAHPSYLLFVPSSVLNTVRLLSPLLIAVQAVQSR